MVNVKKIRILFLGAVLTVIMISCSIEDKIRDAISGIAIDGYLTKATVFLDCNRNFILDAGETAVLTDDSGKFTFSGVNLVDIASCPVVVDATDTTKVIDSDDGVTLAQADRQGFKMSAPAGQYEVVSPMTMVSHIFDEVTEKEDIFAALGLSDADINALSKLGVSSLEDLLSVNYLSTNDLDAAAMAVVSKIANKARVLARVLEAKQSPTNAESNLCEKQRCPILVEEALANFSNVYKKMEAEGKFHSDGRPSADFDYIYDTVAEIEEGVETGHYVEHDFDPIYEGDDKIYATEFLGETILRQASGRPCDAGGNADSSFEYVVFTTFSEPTFPGPVAEPVYVTQTSAQFTTAEQLLALYNASNAQSQTTCTQLFTKKADGLAKRIKAFEYLFASFLDFYTNQTDSPFYLSGSMNPSDSSFSLTNQYIGPDAYPKAGINPNSYTNLLEKVTIIPSLDPSSPYYPIAIADLQSNPLIDLQDVQKTFPHVTDYDAFTNEVYQIMTSMTYSSPQPCFGPDGTLLDCNSVFGTGEYTAVPSKVKSVSYNDLTLDVTITDSESSTPKKFIPMEAFTTKLQESFPSAKDHSGSHGSGDQIPGSHGG